MIKSVDNSSLSLTNLLAVSVRFTQSFYDVMEPAVVSVDVELIGLVSADTDIVITVLVGTFFNNPTTAIGKLECTQKT